MSTRHIATFFGTCCVRLATVLRATVLATVLRCVLRCIETCWGVVGSNLTNFKLQPTTPKCRNTVAKRTQHVAPINVSICWVDMLRSFGRGFTHQNQQFPPASPLACHMTLRSMAPSTSFFPRWTWVSVCCEYASKCCLLRSRGFCSLEEATFVLGNDYESLENPWSVSASTTPVRQRPVKVYHPGRRQTPYRTF